MKVAAGALAAVLLALMAALILVDRRGRPRAPYPWLWALPPGAVIGISLLFGVALYPGLPDSIPTHFDVHGTADTFTTTTPFTALFTIVVQALITAIVAISGGLVLRTADPAAPAVVRGMLLLATAVDLTLLLIALPVWHGRTDLPAATMAGALFCLLAGVAAVLVSAMRAPRAGRADDDRWRGVFYNDPEDPALFVPKRFGIGWTLNLGHPAGRPLMIALLAIPLVTLFVGAFAG